MNDWIPQVAPTPEQRRRQFFGVDRSGYPVRLAETPPKLNERGWVATAWAWLRGAP